jgi:multidrug efflux pump subunit AcrB
MRSVLPQGDLGVSGISAGAIRHYRILVLFVIGLFLVAGMAWRKIPRLENPRDDPKIAVITIPYPGASPEDVEALVVKPVESVLFGMPGVQSVESKALPNRAFMTMHFEQGTEMENAVEAVRGKVLAKRRDLPSEVADPVVMRVKSSTYTVQMVLVLAGNRSGGTLTEAATRIKDAVAGIAGVESVTLRGETTRAVRARIDPVLLAQHHLSVEQVVERVKLANVRVPGGQVRVGPLATLLSVNHELSDSASVAAIAVGASSDGRGAMRTVTLSDVAEVTDDFRTPSERLLHDGVPAVGMEVRFREGENAVDVGQNVRARLDAERGSLPPGVELIIAHDQPAWVEHLLSGLMVSLLEGVLLVMLIITLGMGWRSASVVASVLPLALAGAIFGLYAFGFALEQVSIAGLIVALGLLVDDAIVVTESIQVMRERGLSAVRAAVLGTSRVFWANNGTTFVACASFIPLFFMGGDAASFIRGLPVAVVLALVTSLVVAQFVTPWIATFLVRGPPDVAPISERTPFNRSDDETADHDERNAVLRATKSLYTWGIPWVVRHPWKVIGAATVMLASSVVMLSKVGVLFFPKVDKSALSVSVELAAGTDDSVTAQKVVQIVREIRKDSEVRSTSAIVGGAYPQVFLGRVSHAPSKDFGDILVQVDAGASARVAGRLRATLASIPGARISVEEVYFGPPVAHPIVIRLEGDDYAKLRTHAEALKASLRKIPGTVNVSDTLTASIPLVNVDVDADRAFRFGVTPGHIGATLRSYYGEDKISSFRRGYETVEVVIERAGTTPNPLDLVAQTPVSAESGAQVPILAVGDARFGYGFAELDRRNTRRMVEVSADVDGSALPSEVVSQIRPILDSTKWERGYSYAFGGEQAETEESFRNLGIAATGTLVIVFVLLVLMFQSLSRAVLVVLAVPYALIGAVFGLYVTKTPFGFMAFLGLIALIGVYVNHKIYFVDRVQELLSRGLDWEHSVRQAGVDRLRPVVLTALTAMAGLLPLTLAGSGNWSAFGWVNIFGLATSIPLSLILLPALLTVAEPLRRR